MEYIVLPNNKNMGDYSDFNNVILPLEDYSIGYETKYNASEINDISKSKNVYVLINKYLHKDDINNIKNVLSTINNKVKYFVSDIGLLNLINKENVVLYKKHIISNSETINFYKEININNIVLSNELTYNEIDKIIGKTSSSLYYFYIGRNNIMYSKRKLISNYKEYYNIDDKDSSKLHICEKVSGKEYLLKEEDGTVMFTKLFVGNKYKDILSKLSYLIIDLNLLDESERTIILNNYDKKDLYKMISCDYYFLENEIKYKVSDIR